ncbi:unnamed protein product [Darwinula stevensoni]|uniref:Uncharacterized protein n=1 Tax=Darwinula stevensoni TaxID=69355 RepID=A0A7R9AGB2_9CRUS|nr:unnamed protein product [Darwinula stevensoni]CAG0903858.1 unnamed protein product [Darwinula stevensoni]
MAFNLPRFFKGHKDPLGFRFRKFREETQMHVRMHAEEGWVPNEEDCQYPKEHLGTALGFLCIQDIPGLEDFKILVAPDWERARLEEVKKYISHYFPRMP